MKSYGLLWESSLSSMQRAASNGINKAPYHHHHMTPGAYEKILELISFTDHQDTHSPSFLLQGRDAAPTAPLPHPASLCYRHWWMCTHILLHNDPLAYFTLQPWHSVAVDSDSDLCDSYVTLIGVCTLYSDSLCTYVIMCRFILGMIKALSSRFHLTFLNSLAGMFSH